MLIVWGRNDLLVPVGDAARYQRLIGDNARVEVFEDTGHAPMIERPSRFNELLRGFLAGEWRRRPASRGLRAAAASRRSRRRLCRGRLGGGVGVGGVKRLGELTRR